MLKQWSICALLVQATMLGASASAEVKTIAVLDRAEPYDTMLMHDDVLWVGQSRQNFNSHYTVSAYDKNDALIGTVQLSHSIMHLAIYDKTSVIANGISPDPNLTMYSIIRRDADGGISKTTYQVPMDAWATRWLGTIGGREYFTDPGGNVNDPEAENNPGIAAQTLFGIRRSDPKYLKTRMRMPIAGKVWNNQLLVLQKAGIGVAQSNAALVNPSTGAAEYLFKAHRQDLSNVAILQTRGLALFSERGAGKVIAYDLNTRTEISAATTSGPDPRAITSFGHCALAANYEARTIDIIDFSSPDAPKLAKTVETGLSPDEFARMNQIAVSKTGRLYARSNFACNPMTQVCDKDWNRIVAFDHEITEFIAQNCRL